MTANTYDRIVDLVSTLPYPDLKRLQAYLNDLVSTGSVPTQGYLEYRFITRSGKPYGPYRYRRLWRNGKLIARYEGKATLEEYHAWQAQKTSPSSPVTPED